MTPWRSWLTWEKFVFYFALIVGGALTAIGFAGAGLSLLSVVPLRPEAADDLAILALQMVPAWFFAGTVFNTAGHVPFAIVWGLKKLSLKKG